MRNRLSCLRKGSRDLGGGIDPEDLERSLSNIQETMGHIGGNKARVHGPKLGFDAIDDGKRLSFENGHLLVAIVAVHRSGRTCGKDGRSRRERRRVDSRPSDHQPRFHAVSSLERLDCVIRNNGFGAHGGLHRDGLKEYADE